MGAVRVGMGGSVLLNFAEVAVIEGLVLVELLAELTFDVVAREVRRVVPLVIGRWLVDLSECLFVGANFSGSFQGRVTGNIAEEDSGVIEKFSELSAGGMDLVGFVTWTTKYHSITYPFVMINSPRLLKPDLTSWASRLALSPEIGMPGVVVCGPPFTPSCVVFQMNSCRD